MSASRLSKMRLCLAFLSAVACQPDEGRKSLPNQSIQSPAVGATVPTEPSESEGQHLPLGVRRAHYAITKLYLDRAERILGSAFGPEAAVARARLAVYRADCQTALSHLTTESARQLKSADELVRMVPRCAAATSGGVIVVDEEAGVWLRLQDDADQVLAPLLISVAKRARAILEKDLGETLPRPLRIDLVRDLFSLASVSGLPLEAAETTGTVAVARWGRVTMVSPRAMRRGFPWADTLAHEITHLLISRATADRAPLWLQEGVAKREEHRWRAEQLFDDAVDFSERAFEAERRGRAIGVSNLGPSIAMLPSAEDASIAFAEVTSFMSYWIEQNGPHSLGLLLRDIEVANSAGAAMSSVSGYSIADWELLWRSELKRRFALGEQSEPALHEESVSRRAAAKALRLTELLTVDGQAAAAADYAASQLDQAVHIASFRFFAARAALLQENESWSTLLGSVSDVNEPHAGWLALSARKEGQAQSSAEAEGYFDQALALDPLLPEVACRGVPWVGAVPTQGANVSQKRSRADDLCSHARSLTVRGSR